MTGVVSRAAWIGFMCFVLAVAGVGCSTRTVEGRVVEGRASLGTVIDPLDDRLMDDYEGLADVEIVALSRSGAILAQATSDEEGRFELKPPARFSDQASIEAMHEGFVTCRSMLYLPGDSRRVLVVLQPLR